MWRRTGHEKGFIPGCRASSRLPLSLPQQENVAERWMDFIFGEMPRPWVLAADCVRARRLALAHEKWAVPSSLSSQAWLWLAGTGGAQQNHSDRILLRFSASVLRLIRCLWIHLRGLNSNPALKMLNVVFLPYVNNIKTHVCEGRWFGSTQRQKPCCLHPHLHYCPTSSSWEPTSRLPLGLIFLARLLSMLSR